MDKKRKAFTLETKFEILNEIKKWTKKKAVAEAFGLAPSTLSLILKNEDSIREAYQASIMSPSRKR